MAEAVKYNLVKYHDSDRKLSLTLKLEGAWTIKPGLEPNIFAAIVPSSEFLKFDFDFGTHGKLEFYYNSPDTPDFVMEQITLVDVEPTKEGEVIGADGKLKELDWIEYRLFFSDRREELVPPRGGVLTHGELNKSPLSKDGNQDANRRTTVTTKKILEWCVESMGLTDEITIDHSVSDLPRILDLDWRGNYASEELEKILQQMSYVFVVKADGTFAIEPIGSGLTPVIPEDQRSLSLALSGISRRGSSVVFTSEPLAVVDTVTLRGPSTDPAYGDDFHFVVKNPNGTWSTVEESVYVREQGKPKLSILDLWKDPWKYLSVENYKYVNLLNLYLCRAIRINPGKYGNSPILRALFSPDGTRAGLFAKCVIPIFDGGLWHLDRNDPEQYIEPGQILEGNILHFAEFLVTLKNGNLTIDLRKDAVPMTGGMELKVSREVMDKQADGTWEPRFYYVGYVKEAAGLRRMTEDELDNYLAQKRCQVIPLPGLRLLQVDGVDQNRGDLEKLSYDYAMRYISDSAKKGSLNVVKGFAPIELTGVVAEITIEQTPPKMTWRENGWTFPRYIDRITIERKEGKGGKFPKQAATAEHRAEMGIGSAKQPAVPVAPAAAPTKAGGIIPVDLEKDGGSNGDQTKAPTYTYTVKYQSNELGKALAPVLARPWGLATEATKGLAYYGSDGALVLFYAHEVPPTDACPAEGA